MTDCYLCSHPIIEGQKHRIPSDVAYAIDDPPPETHRNIQDCLPTLLKPGTEWLDVIDRERKRAADLANTLADDWETMAERPYDNEPEFSLAMKAGAQIRQLANAIEKGDQ